MMPRTLMLLSIGLVLSGCSLLERPSPYVPSTMGNPWGYAESPVRPGYMEIGYIGLETLSPEGTRYYATVRAAELSLQAGKPAFEIVSEHSGQGKQVIYIPATYMTVTTTDANGNTTTEEVETEPGHYETHIYPMITLLVHFLDQTRHDARTQDASTIVRTAQAGGTALNQNTLALLPALPSAIHDTDSH